MAQLNEATHMAITTGPQGQASWLYDSSYPLEDYALGTVYFTVDGSFAWLENDNEFNLLELLNPNSAVYGESDHLERGRGSSYHAGAFCAAALHNGTTAAPVLSFFAKPQNSRGK